MDFVLDHSPPCCLCQIHVSLCAIVIDTSIKSIKTRKEKDLVLVLVLVLSVTILLLVNDSQQRNQSETTFEAWSTHEIIIVGSFVRDKFCSGEKVLFYNGPAAPTLC
jgi:hypothetical protein